MIADKDTNSIYFSELLKTDKSFPKSAKLITDILDSFNVTYSFLPNTKDIWARDFMPIQVTETKFIEYRYDPDYLQGKGKGYRDLKTYPDIICETLKLKTIKTDIILDGGNLVKSNNSIILTDKIVNENRFLCNKTELVKRLHELFEVENVILIPWDKNEEYGHSDGVLRFIDEKTVLVNQIYEYDKNLMNCLKKHNLNVEILKVTTSKKHKWRWAYINFLQTKDLILLPKFDIDEDLRAFEQISMYYPDYASKNAIAMVNMSEVVKSGGALNCITWTIK